MREPQKIDKRPEPAATIYFPSGWTHLKALEFAAITHGGWQRLRLLFNEPNNYRTAQFMVEIL